MERKTIKIDERYIGMLGSSLLIALIILCIYYMLGTKKIFYNQFYYYELFKNVDEDDPSYFTHFSDDSPWQKFFIDQGSDYALLEVLKMFLRTLGFALFYCFYEFKKLLILFLLIFGIKVFLNKYKIEVI